MALDEQADSDPSDPLKFQIRSNDPARDELKIIVQCEDDNSKSQWMEILNRQLQRQMDFLRALQAPIDYHRRAKE